MTNQEVRRAMISVRIETLCEDIRKTLGCTALPVDPKAIAQQERILLEPDDYGNGFDGRIEFLLPERLFVIYYQAEYVQVSEVRVRFSLAHELGHFYIDSHREALCQGYAHDSEQGLMADKQREREADSFAASLLIPRNELDRRMGSMRFMDMGQIVQMADDLQVSVPAAAIRYFGYAEEKCAVILSKDGKVKCHLPSDSMREIGLAFMKPGTQLPPKSAARRLLQTESSREIQGIESTTNEWYPQRTYNTLPLYEDSFSLGYDGRVLTLLSVWKA
ncbi:MAG: ImmA/IrrE family metallo-endopeptidase [Kiritimatiellae bacterium]|nr:ImmA/IrrE family metallo-endopeptidase [Kiritimatiellia bacterium]